jgi:hypothetical protein
MAPLPKDDYLTAANAITKQSSSYASFLIFIFFIGLGWFVLM